MVKIENVGLFPGVWQTISIRMHKITTYREDRSESRAACA